MTDRPDSLTWFEFFQAANVGVMRNMQARRLKRPDNHGKDIRDIEGGWGPHIEGACAECLVAKTLNIYWEAVWREIDKSRGDVGDYQVRSTIRENGCLLLHPENPDEAEYILVVGLAPKQRIVGKIRGSEGKKDEYWRTDTGRPAFFVPQAKLTPLPERQAA